MCSTIGKSRLLLAHGTSTFCRFLMESYVSNCAMFDLLYFGFCAAPAKIFICRKIEVLGPYFVKTPIILKRSSEHEDKIPLISIPIFEIKCFLRGVYPHLGRYFVQLKKYVSYHRVYVLLRNKLLAQNEKEV